MKGHTTIMIALALGLSAVAGCHDSITSTTYSAASASITDGTGPGPAPGLAARTSGPQPIGSSFSGSISGSAQVMIYSDAWGWVALGEPTPVSLQMQAADTASVVTFATVPADTYTRVRLVLDGCHADLSAGSVIGTITLSSTESLALGGSDDRVEIDVDVPAFTVSATSAAVVQVNLHSESWVTEANVGSQTVGDADLQAATTASVVTS